MWIESTQPDSDTALVLALPFQPRVQSRFEFIQTLSRSEGLSFTW